MEGRQIAGPSGHIAGAVLLSMGETSQDMIQRSEHLVKSMLESRKAPNCRICYSASALLTWRDRRGQSNGFVVLEATGVKIPDLEDSQNTYNRVFSERLNTHPWIFEILVGYRKAFQWSPTGRVEIKLTILCL